MTYIFTFYCSLHSTVVISLSGQSLTTSKKASVLENIIEKTE